MAKEKLVLGLRPGKEGQRKLGFQRFNTIRWMLLQMCPFVLWSPRPRPNVSSLLWQGRDALGYVTEGEVWGGCVGLDEWRICGSWWMSEERSSKVFLKNGKRSKEGWRCSQDKEMKWDMVHGRGSDQCLWGCEGKDEEQGTCSATTTEGPNYKRW